MVRRTDHWVSTIQHSVTGEMLRKGEMIDEVGKWIKISCGESLYLCRSFRVSCHFSNLLTRLFSIHHLL
jgi:hypothetical protein